MSDNTDTNTTEAPTRRDYVKYGGAVIGGGLLAGCSGGDPSSTTSGATTADETESTTTSETSSQSGQSYSVAMAPMGEVSFDSVPEAVYTGLPNTADMAIAAGKADAINSIYFPEYHGTLLNHFYERLDGVSLDWKNLKDSWGLGKEGFYELDSDVHLTDPAYATTLDSLDQADIEEIREQIAPWFGNYYSNTHSTPPTQWADGYQYYSLWEIFEKVAEVFQAKEHYQALYEERQQLLSTVEEKRPPKDEQPTVALTFPVEDHVGVFHLNAPGFLAANTRPLGAVDAFADMDFERNAQVDMEAMAEADPDVVLALFRLSSSYSIAETKKRFRDDPVGQTISAAKNDRIYAQGVRYQGPIVNLFQTEMTAKQLYPEQLGEWPGYVDGEDYPEIPESEQLFDRERVADIVNGEI
ncbi:ABC-type Fe3+-hydroxamate transport system substrate-binding protein [Halarchaeum solikamskense]|uniref:ABC transporter substrate-binding protein n=1 Tax=Halarchaeum nitratireducens TaxID=489913 RepID=UPI001B3B0FAC|nr:ABC transporter substrate-binding protein [Halarchaeum solikamskense]MBP2251090.1 ABC-type Fe3+-hydroxamate transport system substrate-binding protein [Halarchaeum solikamskense]